jgi:hypothetical protein
MEQDVRIQRSSSGLGMELYNAAVSTRREE